MVLKYAIKIRAVIALSLSSTKTLNKRDDDFDYRGRGWCRLDAGLMTVVVDDRWQPFYSDHEFKIPENNFTFAKIQTKLQSTFVWKLFRMFQI